LNRSNLFCLYVNDKEKSFMQVTKNVKLGEICFYPLTKRPNKLKCLVSGKPSQPNLIFECKVVGLP
jgi:hypothetical protein